MELYRENFRNLPVPNHKAYGYQILHVALSSGPSPRGVNYNPRVELIAKGYKFYIGLYSEILRNLANGFHVSASGAIQGHHGPLVLTFCNISVITEDIDLKLGVYVQYPKSNPYDQGSQFKMHFFFLELCPFF